MARPAVAVERVYDEPADTTTYRVLVDRLWPRGIRKDSLRYDHWAKDLAPSTELRIWYGHDPDRFDEFRARYLTELSTDGARDAVDDLLDRADGRSLTLLTATRDTDHSGARVLADRLAGR